MMLGELKFRIFDGNLLKWFSFQNWHQWEFKYLKQNFDRLDFFLLTFLKVYLYYFKKSEQKKR